MEHDNLARPVAVVGAGLAGLTAAAAAARAGRPVVIFETRTPGGRARTDHRAGFLLNQGPHALFLGGPGARVLSRLGIVTKGHWPRVLGSRLLVDGGLQPALSRAVLGIRGKARVLATLARIGRTDPQDWRGSSMADWIDSAELLPRPRAVMEAFVRVATYVADLENFSAEVGLAQLRASVKGVSYLDGGWEQLTGKLLDAATTAGAELRTDTAVQAVTGQPGAWRVRTQTEETAVAAVVLAPGNPAATRRLLPIDPSWGELGPEVTAACLDLGVTGRRPAFCLGIDEPLYLSAHAPPGDLAPPGHSLVHLMRYGARTSEEDRGQLWDLAQADGIRPEDVTVERFLHRMVVASCLPPPEGGSESRPAVTVNEAPGLFLAGDWVGPQGWLGGASLASGEKAGLLAAEAAGSVDELAGPSRSPMRRSVRLRAP